MLDLDFVWQVSDTGYRWEMASDGGDQHVLLANKPFPNRRTWPLRDHPALHMEFADVSQDLKALLAFADVHGHLGGRIEVFDGTDKGMQVYAGETEPPETSAEWQGEIEAMDRAIKLRERIRFEEADPDLLNGLAEEVNRRLESRYQVKLAYLTDERRSEWIFRPTNLLGAIWLSFAAAVTDGRDYLKCPTCGTWFDPSGENARRKKQYCSMSCRQKAYRGRKELAIELARGGRNAVEIAAELGLDGTKVREWLLAAGVLDSQDYNGRNLRNINFKGGIGESDDSADGPSAG